MHSKNISIDQIAERIRDPQRNGDKLEGYCPAHDDRRRDLVARQDPGGTLRVKCFAGCSEASIYRALGLPHPYPGASKPAPVYGNDQNLERQRNTVDERSTKSVDTTPSLGREAIAEPDRGNGRSSAQEPNYDEELNLNDTASRRKHSAEKNFHSNAPIGNRNQPQVIGEPRQLSGLIEVAKSETVYVCEGEKGAEALRAIELTATTSGHGSQSVAKSDWSPLAGKTVVILSGSSRPGRTYAEAVASLLGKLMPRPIVKTVELPGIPGGDVVDWINNFGDAAEPQTMREELGKLVAAVDPEIPERPTCSLQFQPFPVDELSNPLCPIVERAAKALGCDPSFIALPLLTALAAAIGNTRRLRLKPGWEVPPILWTAIVARSGDVKSPAIDVARNPVQARQKKALKQYEAQHRLYKIELEKYERERHKFQCNKRNDIPERPTEPTAERYWCDDVTLEAVVARLQLQPRGLLLVRDELAGWFGGFDRYAGGKGGDAPRWLETFGGRPLVIDRKLGGMTSIDRAAICITGSIQPAILKRVLSPQYRESGLAARMLFAFPPRRAKRWTDTAIKPTDKKAITLIFDRLYELEFETDAEGELVPSTIDMTAEAKSLYVGYFNKHNREAGNLGDDLGAAWSKLEEYPARLALVIHYIRWATNGINLADELQLDAESMAAGIKLAEWFANEARRIYAMLDESDDDAERRNLVAWIERRGGRATAREVKQGNRSFPTTEDAEKALIELVELKYGTWEPPSGGPGKPARRFILSTQSAVYGNSSEPEKNTNNVDVDTVDEAEESGDWEEV